MQNNICFIKASCRGRYAAAAKSFLENMFYEKIIPQRSNSLPSKGIFVEINDEIVGMATYDNYGSAIEATVTFIYLKPAFRKIGIGSALLRELENNLSHSGYIKLYIKAVTSDMDSLLDKFSYDMPTGCRTKVLSLKAITHLSHDEFRS